MSSAGLSGLMIRVGSCLIIIVLTLRLTTIYTTISAAMSRVTVAPTERIPAHDTEIEGGHCQQQFPVKQDQK